MEIHTRRCYNYFGYLYVDFALAYVELILSMKAWNDYEAQKQDVFVDSCYDGIRDVGRLW